MLLVLCPLPDSLKSKKKNRLDSSPGKCPHLPRPAGRKFTNHTKSFTPNSFPQEEMLPINLFILLGILSPAFLNAANWKPDYLFPHDSHDLKLVLSELSKDLSKPLGASSVVKNTITAGKNKISTNSVGTWPTTPSYAKFSYYTDAACATDPFQVSTVLLDTCLSFFTTSALFSCGKSH